MTEHIFYREDGTTCVIPKEEWCWVAQYEDGTCLKQFDDEGRFHQFREIQQDKLASFLMVHENRPPFVVQWQPGMKLIHFYRNLRLEIGTPNELSCRLYCFGYESADTKVIMIIMPDGGMVITDDVNKVTIGR